MVENDRTFAKDADYPDSPQATIDLSSISTENFKLDKGVNKYIFAVGSSIKKQISNKVEIEIIVCGKEKLTLKSDESFEVNVVKDFFNPGLIEYVKPDVF